MMTPTKLMTLAIVTAVAVGAATISVQSSQATIAQADRGKSFLPDLIGKMNAIDGIVIRNEAATTKLRRDVDHFVDDSGFPVREDAVRNLLTGMSLLTIEERKTDQPKRYKDLELAAPDAEGGGTQVILQSDGTTLADLVVGVRDPSVGGSSGGVFVRRTESPPAYLLRGAVPLPGSRSGWFETELFKLGADKILNAEIKPVQGQPIRLAQSASTNTLVLDNLPPAGSADPAKIQRLANLAAGLSFEDVRKATGALSGAELTTVGADKRRYVVSPVGKFDPENTWVQIKIQPSSMKDVNDAKKESERFDGFEFKLTRHNSEPFGWTLTDVLNQAPPANPAIPGNPANPVGPLPGIPAPVK